MMSIPSTGGGFEGGERAAKRRVANSDVGLRAVEKGKDTIMNRQELYIDDKSGVARSARGPLGHEIRSASVTRIGVWLTYGFSLACAQPLMWLATILASADLATALELAVPFQRLAVLLLAVLGGAILLTPAGIGGVQRRRFGSTLAALIRHRDALLTVVLAAAAIVAVGYVLSFALLHVKLTASMMPGGAHSLSIIFGHANDRTAALCPVLHAVAFAVAIAAVWFAPALIVLQQRPPFEAMLTSLRAMFHNGPVALVYAAVLAADAMLVPVAPMPIRALVLTPLISALILLSMHGSYRDILSIDPSRED